MKSLNQGIFTFGLIACSLFWQGSSLSAATKYVTPTGTSPYDGNDWTSAYSNIQDAVNACLAEASTIYIRTGKYAIGTQIGVGSAVDLTFQGGCTGSGTTTTTNDPTVIYRSTGNIKLLAATNSLLKLDNLSFTNGFGRDGANTLGFTIHLMNCRSTFTNCAVRDNSSNGSADSGQYGIGIYASKGSLVLRDCLFQNNLDAEGLIQYGGAVYASGGAVTSINCRFIGNTAIGNTAAGGGFFLTSCTNS